MPRPTLPLPPSELPASADGAANGSADGAAKARPGRWRTLTNVGPVVAEAMTVNAVLRAFSGYILFLLAFLLRSVDLGTVFGHAVSHNFALGALALGLSVGSLTSMILGSFFKGRAPQLIMFSVLIIAPVVTAVCAWGFGLLGSRPRRGHGDLLRQPRQARPGLDRRPGNRRRDPVLDVRGLRDAQPGGERGRRPGRRARCRCSTTARPAWASPQAVSSWRPSLLVARRRRGVRELRPARPRAESRGVPAPSPGDTARCPSRRP